MLPYVTHDARFARLVFGHANLEKLSSGYRWAEGPAYFPAGRYLIWDDEGDLAARWIDLVHVGGANLGFGLLALVVAVDAVGRIRKPDRAVRLHHDVVGRVQPTPLELVGKHRDGAVVQRVFTLSEWPGRSPLGELLEYRRCESPEDYRLSPHQPKLRSLIYRAS